MDDIVKCPICGSKDMILVEKKETIRHEYEYLYECRECGNKFLIKIKPCKQ